jgi:Kef-type K+ transport system membrane component KefB
MSTGLVIVLAVAAVIPLLLGLMPRLPLPGPVVEIVAGVAIGPSVLAWVDPDETIRALSVLGLSFLLFLAGFEVDIRCFRGHAGRRVLVALIGSLMLATGMGLVFAAGGMHGGLLVGIALLATSLGLIVPVLADAGLLHAPVGVLTVACASAGEVAAVVALSLGGAGSDMPLAGRVLLLGLLTVLIAAIAAVVVGAEHIGTRGRISARPRRQRAVGRVTIAGDIAAVPVDRVPDRSPDGATRTHHSGRISRRRRRLGPGLPAANPAATGVTSARATWAVVQAAIAVVQNRVGPHNNRRPTGR